MIYDPERALLSYKLLIFLPRCMECRRGLYSDEDSVCPSVRLSVCQTRAL